MKVYSTFHPAALLRFPSRGLAVESHLEFLDRAMAGRDLYDLVEFPYDLCPSPPDYPIRKLSLDIETYGILETMPLQTKWHPEKSLAYDGVTPDDLIQTIACSWRDPGGTLKSGLYTKTTGFDACWALIRRVLRDAGTLLGQNFTFDLSFIRRGCPDTKAWLRPPLALGDLSIVNYLHNETRPERSLKSLAPLLAVSRYEGGFKRYSSCDDPELGAYNVQDSASTLLAEEKLWASILAYYGEDSPKLSAFSLKWYSDLLWLILSMFENGVTMDQGGLVELMDRYSRRSSFLVDYAKTKWDMALKGKGSERAKRGTLQDGIDFLQESRVSIPSLVLTEKQKKLSFCDENRHKLLGLLPRTSDPARRLRVIGRYADVSKLLDSYMKPLLVGRGKNNKDKATCLINGIIYPRWYPCPSQYDDGGAGGTVQSRIVCREPGVQTFPPPIKKRIISRFGHELVWFDLSQIELRVAALLSNDPVMLREYEGNIDRHTETAKLLFSPGIVTHHAFKTLYRQAGKTLNFLVLFRGGAKKFQETLLRDVGLYVPLQECRDAIHKMQAKYQRLWEWQDELIAEAKKYGFLQLPLIGQSRLYLGGNSSVEEAMNEVVNQPVQTTASNIMLSIQMELMRAFDERNMKSVCPLNIYDAAPIEVYSGELPVVLELLETIIPSPPYFVELCRHLGRTIQIKYEYHVDGA